MDMAKLLSIISKMDKKELEQGISQASKFLNENDTKNLMNAINTMNNNGNK